MAKHKYSKNANELPYESILINLPDILVNGSPSLITKLQKTLILPLSIIRLPLAFFVSFSSMPIGILRLVNEKFPILFRIIINKTNDLRFRKKLEAILNENIIISQNGEEIKNISLTHKVELKEINLKKGAGVENSRGLYLKNKNVKNDNANRKIIMFFDGNAECLATSIKCYGPLVVNSKSLDSFDHYMIEPPKLSLGMDDQKLIRLGQAHLYYILSKLGYKPENIIILSHSLGAYAVKVIESFKGLNLNNQVIGKDVDFSGLLISKSFTKISEVILGKILAKYVSNNPEYFQKQKYNPLTWMLASLFSNLAKFLKWEINVVDAIKEGLPVKKIYIYNHNNDTIIPGFGALASNIFNDEKIEVIILKEKIEGVSNNHAYVFYDESVRGDQRLIIENEQTMLEKIREL
ncbi:MAG: hypothetical protein J0H68_01930 [Sphingobacteriia bacterium]|nr:hypothetical protein [Sphingobacteriia bacterium]